MWSSLIALAGKFTIGNELAVSVDDLRPIVILIAIVGRMRNGQEQIALLLCALFHAAIGIAPTATALSLRTKEKFFSKEHICEGSAAT